MAPLAEIQTRDNPDIPSNAPKILIATGFMTGFSLVVVSLRVYVRAFMTKNFGADDGLIIAAMVIGIATMVCFVGDTQNGAGRPLSTIQVPDEYVALRKWQWSSVVIMISGICLVKMSVGFFLLRLTAGTKFRRFIMFMTVFIAVVTIAFEGPLIFECQPISVTWLYKRPADANCLPQKVFNAVGSTNGAINVVTDFIFVMLPIHIILGLQLNWRTKLSLVCVLSLGLFACATAIVRAVLGAKFLTGDFTRTYDYWVWNAAELHAGILAASLPTLRPLFKRILERTNRRYGTNERPTNEPRTGYIKQSESVQEFGLDTLRPWAVDNPYTTHVSSQAHADASDEASIPSPPEGTIARQTEIRVHSK